MTIKALIVDDEPLAHEVILAYLEDVPFIEVTGRCHLATEALAFLSEQVVDLIFLFADLFKLFVLIHTSNIKTMNLLNLPLYFVVFKILFF